MAETYNQLVTITTPGTMKAIRLDEENLRAWGD